MKIHVFLIPILPLLIPAGLGEWWSTSWAQHHGTEHFHPEGPKAHRLCAPDQSTVYPSFHFLQKGAIIMYLNDCNVCICILCSIINVDIANVKKADFFHSAFSKDFCHVVKWEIFFLSEKMQLKDKKSDHFKTVLVFHQACVLQRQRKGSVSSDASASTDSNTYYEDDFSSTEEDSSQGTGFKQIISWLQKASLKSKVMHSHSKKKIICLAVVWT